MEIQRHRSSAPGMNGSGGNLADILERVLDKGIVVAGDIRVNLLDIELLTIKLRLLIASADTAREMGIDWWQHDPFLTGNNASRGAGDGESGGGGGAGREVQDGSRGELEARRELSERLERIEAALQALASDRPSPPEGSG